MALQAPPELIGVHTNMPATVPDDVAKALQFGEPPPSGFRPTRRARGTSSTSSISTAWATPRRWRTVRRRSMRLRIPRSDWPPGCSITTRAVYALIARVFDGQTEGLTRDDILDNITLYWLTNTAVSSARLYWESKLAFFAPKGVASPDGGERLSRRDLRGPAELDGESLSQADLLQPSSPRAATLAAWEQPQLFSEEMRASFRSLR